MSAKKLPLTNVSPLCVGVVEAAAMLRLSETVVRSYIDKRLIPTVRFPSHHNGGSSRRVLIAVSDLTAFMEQHRVTEKEQQQ